MILYIDTEEYSTLKNLSFSPGVDFTGDSLQINEFSVDVITSDAIAEEQMAILRDDRGRLWARYWIVSAQQVKAGVTHIRAQSLLCLLPDEPLPAVMYEGEPVEDVLEDTICSLKSRVGSDDYVLDTIFGGETITGFCPEQTARERLQWVCYAIGAYVKTAFTDKIEILSVEGSGISGSDILIPLKDTYMRPTVERGDIVTGVKVTSYAFSQSDTASEDANSYVFPLPWVATPQVLELSNPAAPTGANANVVEVEGNYLIGPTNAGAVLAYMARWYFNRDAVRLDCINNADYVPGDKATCYTAPDTLYTGYIQEAAFSFGKQAKAALTLKAVEGVESGSLTVLYVWNGVTLAREHYTLPVGTGYNMQTRYLDMTMGGHRYVFRPTTASITGTVVAEGSTVTVECAVALDLFEGVLDVVSVDGMSAGTDLYTMVIA